MDNFGAVLGASQKAVNLIDSIRPFLSWSLIIDIVIVSTIFYWIFLFLRETRAMRILYGLLLLLILMAIGHVFNLILLNWMLKYSMTMLVVAIPVVFQPELRAALERLGRTKFLGELAFTKEKSSQVIDEIVEAAMSFSKQKTGCLIVIQRQTGLREYIETGVRLNALISRSLLSSIFYPKSPLHDGAAIIFGNKILSAQSILPVSNAILSSNLGTRHRAGLGITENSDAISIIVSEETGTVSMAVGGKLERRISEDRLKTRLKYLMRSVMRAHD